MAGGTSYLRVSRTSIPTPQTNKNFIHEILLQFKAKDFLWWLIKHHDISMYGGMDILNFAILISASGGSDLSASRRGRFNPWAINIL
jgi:hypothetical protein